MPGYVKSNHRGARRRSEIACEESSLARGILVTVALLFSVAFLLMPLLNVFAQALVQGWNFYFSSLLDPDTRAAIRLTLTVAAITVPLNSVFGIAAAWAIAKFNFRGRALLTALIDLPFAVSPVVVGLMLVLMCGRQGFLGPWLEEHNIKILFSLPGIVLATVFITFPFVARELIPVMQATGTEQEQAALTLGASGWRTFWHVTLPNVAWGLLYGVLLCNARAMGEFGAVSVVSGHIRGETLTMPLQVEMLYNDYDFVGAFAAASLLASLGLVTLVLKTALEWRHAGELSANRRH